ncbi:5'/3'-nucleotidase SurE [Cyphellophora europaea CBS 101466]|uniref:5'/3'-nucleotidase SurE n=1 Tax=Cyphellophora europaea (strain CBS 101466) TaxID=1220924 RepID=W2S6W7_CYPE1|nr:5'/3'-nucleotidase SurE [Cyphellophora europaea CBS 101466]ETN44407.1 5'/3'-nucleotidase SurE [Cyphellophora europaea CBS 101466]
MRSSLILAAFAATSASALNILLGNDDGFGSAQLRQLNDLLKADGHKTIVVAPVDNESGQGGRAVYTTSPNLTVASEFGLVSAGAPSLGRDPKDPDVWYYNGTPAACTFVALDYVIPKYYNNVSIDLYTGGPNFGGNLGPFLYTLSGTMGGTYAAIGRSIPGIAFSAANSEQRSYTWINETTKSGHPDPAVIQAQLAYTIVSQLINSTKPGERILPYGYGIGVNTPVITSLSNDSCIAPPFVQTRLTGGAFTDTAVYNATRGTFTYGNLQTEGLNRCINGDCALPGETDVVDGGCYSSVSVFTIDYDAPTGQDQTSIRSALEPVVPFQNKDGWASVKKRDTQIWEASAPLRHE